MNIFPFLLLSQVSAAFCPAQLMQGGVLALILKNITVRMSILLSINTTNPVSLLNRWQVVAGVISSAVMSLVNTVPGRENLSQKFPQTEVSGFTERSMCDARSDLSLKVSTCSQAQAAYS